MRIVDVDSHITEPEDVFTSRVSSKWGDLVPHVKWTDTSPAWNRGGGMELAWFAGDEKLAPAYGTAQAGFAGRYPEYPKTPEEAHPAAWDAAERIKVLDESGVDIAVLYGNIGGFGNQGFLKLREPELMLECVRAYNDFVIDWASVAPERFIPLCAVPMWDIAAAVAEVERAFSIGHLGVVFSGEPQKFGFPLLSDMAWDPLWSVMEEARAPLHFHVGSGDISITYNPQRAAAEGKARMFARSTSELMFAIAQQVNELLFSGILVRHPELKFIGVESGIGWVPFLLETADHHFERGSVRKHHPEFELLPSEYFKRQCAVTYWFEEADPDVFEKVGIDNIMFETDFPHPTGLWKDEVRQVTSGLDVMGDEAKAKILHGNAERFYGLVPSMTST